MKEFGFEDDGIKPSLLIELVPSTSWGDNLRSKLPKGKWDELRKQCYKLAGYRCEVCGKPGLVHAHEVWSYDDEKHIQKLVRLIALCVPCHGVKHFGRTQAIGEGEEATKHLMNVNSWTRAQAITHIREAFKIWEQRSQYPWTLDISKILV